MNSLQGILKEIKEPAEIIQFAKDGKYEEAWIISLSRPRPTKPEIENYFKDASFKELIVEYIWKPNDDSRRYVLTVVHENKGTKNWNEFVNLCLDIFYSQSDLSTVTKQLDQKLIGKDFLLKQPVDVVRLGVFNHWFSVGPIDLWKKGEEFNLANIEEKIKARPEVEKSKLNYQGLAFIFNFNKEENGPYHVLKTPCCKKIGEEWTIDVPLVLKMMESLLS